MKHFALTATGIFAALAAPACASSSAPLASASIAAASQAPLMILGESTGARLLRAHNRYRAEVGSVPLRWDSQLQQDAAAYARQLAAMGRLRHASPEALRGQGENIWMGTKGAFTPERAVTDWASGRRHFQPGVFPNVSRTGNWLDVAHYTQIIWPHTHSVGCAVWGSASHDYLVCRYRVAGNAIGTRIL